MTGKIKSKWVNAFKNVKGGQQSNAAAPGGPGEAPAAAAASVPAVLETSHQFAE